MCIAISVQSLCNRHFSKHLTLEVRTSKMIILINVTELNQLMVKTDDGVWKFNSKKKAISSFKTHQSFFIPLLKELYGIEVSTNRSWSKSGQGDSKYMAKCVTSLS